MCPRDNHVNAPPFLQGLLGLGVILAKKVYEEYAGAFLRVVVE